MNLQVVLYIISSFQSPLHETGSTHDETSSSGNKEDDDDLEDDSDDLKSIPHDPERLKAFNVSSTCFRIWMYAFYYIIT